jgi:mRNA export factor
LTERHRSIQTSNDEQSPHSRETAAMAGLFGAQSAAASNTLGDLKQDVELGSPPEDSISDLAFNPNPTDPKDFLAVASWDKKVRIYEIMSNGQGQGKAQIDHDGPVFSVDFFKVGGYLRFRAD